MPKTVSYQEYLIKSLEEPIEAAAYIEAILEAENPERELLLSSLEDVMEAYGGINKLSDKARQSYEQLKDLLWKTGGEEIYSLVNFLDALGFQLQVRVKSEELEENTETERAVTPEHSSVG
jgi:DNA-binding phage protein